MKTAVFRILPGQDLRTEIDRFVASKNFCAAVLLTCVGSLTKAVLRTAGAKETKTWKGHFEIVSLVGTMEPGNSHLHIALSDSQGNLIGGHLQNGSIVGTTAEVVVGELEDLQFTRALDQQTGFEELVIQKRP